MGVCAWTLHWTLLQKKTLLLCLSQLCALTVSLCSLYGVRLFEVRQTAVVSRVHVKARPVNATFAKLRSCNGDAPSAFARVLPGLAWPGLRETATRAALCDEQCTLVRARRRRELVARPHFMSTPPPLTLADAMCRRGASSRKTTRQMFLPRIPFPHSFAQRPFLQCASRCSQRAQHALKCLPFSSAHFLRAFIVAKFAFVDLAEPNLH